MAGNLDNNDASLLKCIKKLEGVKDFKIHTHNLKKEAVFSFLMHLTIPPYVEKYFF